MSFVKVLFLLGPMVLGLAAPAAAQTNWTFSTPYPDKLFHVENIKLFVDEVEKRSEGKLKITLYTAESLVKHADTMQALRSGQVDLAEFQLQQFANQDELYNFEALPFVATNYDDMMRLWEAAKPFVDQRLEKAGIRRLYTVPWPPQAFYAKRPIPTVADMKGLKFRVYSRMGARMAELLGAQPGLVGGGEVPQAFATGMIDSMITSSAFGASAKAWDFVENFYDVQALLGVNQIAVNQRSFRRLSPELQQIVLSAAENAAKRGLSMSQQANDEQKGVLVKNGMKVIAPTPEFMAEARRLAKPVVDEWAQKVGDEAKQILDKFAAGRT